MIKRLLLLLLLLNALNQRCLQGCLRCSEDNRCKFCNILKGYSLEYGRCIKKQVANCLEVNEKNRCKTCEEKFYLDTVSLRCVELPVSTNVENCLYHLGPGSCRQCQTGFSIKKGACFEISSPIDQCEIENFRGECQRCKSGFILSLDEKSCIAQPENNNCASFSNIQCNECSAGYLKNENYYLNFIFGFKNTKQYQLLTEYLQNSTNDVVDGFKFKTCQKTLVDNCLIFQTADRCKKCTTGFFVNRKYKCEKVPEPTIQNCRKYSSLTTCFDCAQGYYLKSSEECSPIFPIDNCFLYKTDSNTSTCTRCNEEYYLSAENLCTLRSVISKIDFCETLAFDFEKCTKCNYGYIPTTDGLRCLPKIENCEKYVYSNRISFNLDCQTCRDGFYYNENDKVCIKGNLDYCEVYNRVKNECELCEPLYFLVGTICRPHEIIEYCDDYSETDQNMCNKCTQHHFLFTAEHLCVEVDRISHCEEYLTKTTCRECEKGFYLTNPSVCQLILPGENCVEKKLIGDEYLCVECREGFVLSTDKKCLQPHQYFTQGCQENNIDGKNNFGDLECEYCSQNFVPLNFKNSFYCMEKNLVKDSIGYDNLTLDPDCLQFKKNGDTDMMDCLKCKKDMVLVNNRCMPNCTEAENQTIYRQYVSLHNLDGDDDRESVQIEKTNFCYKTIRNCKYASLSIEQSFVNPEYACEECVSEYLPIITVGHNSKSVIKFNPRNRKHDIHMPSNYAPALQCQKYDDFTHFVGNVKQKDDNRFIENCEYYYSVDRKTLGCFKCQHGMTGKVVSKVKNCELFANAEECSKCDQGYYLHSAAECKSVIPINHCTLYNQTANESKCTKCENDYYVDTPNNICVKRIVSYRKLYSTKETDADEFTCTSGYTEISNICQRLPEMCKTATDAGGNIQCTVCDEKKAYILPNSDCKLGTIPNCEEFTTNAHTCAKCAYNHYISGGGTKCVLNVNTSGMSDQILCEAFSQANAFQCDTCKLGAYKFDIINKCVPKVNDVANCALWEDEYRCKDCDEGYYLNNLSRRCLLIDETTDKCLVYNTNDVVVDGLFDIQDQVEPNKYTHTCTKCRPSFYLIDGVCEEYLDLMRENCEYSNVNGEVSVGEGKGCTGCKNTFYPMDFSNKFVCLNRKYLSQKVNGFVPGTDCERYIFDGTNYKCELCKYPKFLNGTVCSSTCTTGAKIILQFVNKYTVKRNFCGTPTNVITGCEEYIDSYQGDLIWNYKTAPADQTDLVQACAKCASDKIPIFEKGAGNQITTFININRGENGNDSYDFVNERYSLPKACVDNTNDLVVGLKNTSKLIDHCELYINLDSAAGSISYGCFKCKWGYTGRVNKIIDSVDPAVSYGYIEYCEEIEFCDTAKRYGGLQSYTNFIKVNGSINNYFTCHKCTGTKILTGFFDWDTAGVGVAEIKGFVPFRFDSDKAAAATSETDIKLEDYSYALKCVDEAVFFNDDAVDADGKKSRVFISATYPGVAKCGLRIVNTKNTGTYATPSLYQCIACEPGYIPTYDATNFYITACTVADVTTNFCDGTLSQPNFNSCSDCVLAYDNDLKTVKFDDCYQPVTANTFIANCFAAYQDATPTDTCVICKPGYELVNNSCLQIATPLCSSTNFTNNNLLDVSNFKAEYLTANYYLYTRLGIQGCLKCSNVSDVLVKHEKDVNLDKFICAIPFTGQFTFIPNCEIIGWEENKIICKRCNPTFMLIGDDECVDETPLTDLPKCKRTLDKLGSVCEQCYPDAGDNYYLNIGGWCTLVKDVGGITSDGIVDCVKYNISESISSTQSVCEECSPGKYVVEENGMTSCNNITIPNCLKFNPLNGCLKCERGYGKISKLVNGILRGACIKLNTHNGANLFDHDNDCEELETDGADKLQDFKLNCKKCTTGVLRKIADVVSQENWCYSVVDNTSNCAVYDMNGNPGFSFISSELHCNSCDPIDNDEFFNPNERTCPTRTTISNCEEYEIKINRCKTCENGYKLDENGENCVNVASTVGNGYIETCRNMNTCEENIHYDGLSATLTSIFSCHKCRNPNEIPIAAVEVEYDNEKKGFFEIKNLTRFSYLSSTTTYDDADGNESVVQCMEINQANLGMSAPSDFNFPTKCGLALTKVNYPKNNAESTVDPVTDKNQVGVTCAACQPGYRPSFSKFTDVNVFVVNYMVSDCTLIEFCEFSRWFNSCTQCNADHSFGYSKEEGIDFSTCVPYAENKHCLSVETILSTKKCRFCKKGTFMNKDGICEIIKPTRCKFQEFKFITYFRENDLNLALTDYSRNVGCSQCEEGFVGIYSEKDKYICTHSLYHSEASFVTNTFYIKNCENYSITDKGRLICKKCNEESGDVVSQDGKCLPKENLTNCKIACDENLCGICNEGKILVNRECVDPTIDNCEKYGNNYLFNDKNCNMAGLQDQVCISCEDEFYLNSGVCSKGMVPNCENMETKYICNKCQDNFTLVTMKEGRSYCYPIDKEYKCKQFDAKKFQSSVLSCEECVEENYIRSESRTDFYQRSCMSFRYVENCIRYDNNPIAIADSSFVCLECNKNTFLQKGQCLERMSKPAECSEFDKLSDKCLKCHVGYFISPDGINCGPYPQGLNGCRIYRTKTTCKACETGKYLREGICLDVVNEIPNCIFYDDETICTECEIGFLNIKGKCVQAVAKDCESYEGVNACRSCRPDAGLKMELGILNCVQQNIQNCVSFENVEPYKCIICATDFFPNQEGACDAVTTVIEKCMIYSDHDTCEKCQKGSALSQDKKNCLFTSDVISNLDRNCEDSSIPELPICNTCKPGFRFSFGKCVSCNQELIDSGCANCDPDFPDVCLMCGEGWIQTPEGTCTQPLVESSGIVAN